MKINGIITRDFWGHIKGDRFQRIIDALQGEGISPELEERMQRHVCIHGTDEQWERAYLRYAERFEPAEFTLEGASLEGYNKLAARLGLRQLTQEEAATDISPEGIEEIKACFAHGRRERVLRRLQSLSVWRRIGGRRG